MADNLQLNLGADGAKLATAEVTFSGDTADVQIVGAGFVSGTAESYSVALASAGAGTVGTGVQRVTLASDDPAVVDLAAIEVLITSGNALLTTIDGDTGAIKTAIELLDNAISGAGYNITQFAGAAVPIGAGVEATALRVTIATDSTGVLSVDDNGGSLTVDGTFWQGTQPVSGTVTADAGSGFGSIAVVGGGVEATALRVTIASDSTGVLEVVQATAADLKMTEASAAAIKTAVELIDDPIAVLGTATYSEATTKGMIAGVVRNDTLAPLAGTDNEIAPLQVDALGALWTALAPNVVDSGNSTTSTLGIGATFTGTGVEVLSAGGITVQVFADQDSAAAGMRFEFSTDNSNWDVSRQFDYIASTGRTFQFTTQARYFRVVFVNGGTGQGAVRIQTVLHGEPLSPSTVHRLDDSLTPDRSATVIKASIMAQAAGSGNFVPIDATASGNLKVSIEEVDGGASLAVTNGGTFVIQENGAALTALQLIDDTVVVLGTATYAEATTKGNVIGAVRNDDLATLANTDNEIAPLQVDNQGALYTNLAAAENKSASGVAAGGAPGTDDMIAAVAGKKILVTAMSLTSTSTTTNSVFVDNVDNDLWANTANPIPLSIDADGDTVAGIVLPYNPAGWFKTDTVNEAVTLNSSAAQDIAWSISWIETD